MLKEYSIADIIPAKAATSPCYTGTFEGTKDPDIEWPHRHSFYSLVWFTKGEGFYVIDFQEYEIKPYRLFLVSPRQIHNWDYAPESEGYVLMIDAPFGIEVGIGSLPAFIDPPASYIPTLVNCFNHLISEYGIHDHLSDHHLKIGIQYLCSIINRITVQANIPVQTHPVIDRFRLLIVAEEINYDIEYYARNLQLPTEELSRICKECIGLSPKQYLLDLRMTEAKRLLLFSKLNTSEIAYKTGFEDASYFARIFKKKTSLSPTAFAEKYRNGR